MSAYTTLTITREEAIDALIKKHMPEFKKTLKEIYFNDKTNEDLERECEKEEVMGVLYNYRISE